MSLPLKILLPIAGGAFGLAVAIPIATSSYSSGTGTTNKVEKVTPSQPSEPERLGQGALSDFPSSQALSSERDEQDSEVQASKNEQKCKLIVLKEERGKMKMCLKEGSEAKVEFIFDQGTVADGAPIKVKELKVTSQELVLTLDEAIEYGNIVEFDLPIRFHSGAGEIVFVGMTARSMKFTENDCVVETVNSGQSGQRVDWRARCTLQPIS